MFGTNRNTSADLFLFRQGNLGIPQASFLSVLNPSPNTWWTTNGVGAAWLIAANAFNGNLTNNTFSSNNFGSATNLGEIVINGDFIVNQDLYLQYSNIRVGSNARIIVEPGRVLIISSCWIHACDEGSSMWRGIEVLPGGLLQILAHSLIEDALIAVNIANGSLLDLNNVTFNKNKVGVNLNGPIIRGVNINGPNLGAYIESVDFTCVQTSSIGAIGYNPLLPYIPVSLNSPFTSQKSDAGIISKGLSAAFSLNVGINSAAHENYFVNQDIGISATDSWLTVLNSHFFDIKKQSVFPSSQGVAILVDAKYSTETLTSTNVKCIVGDDIPSTLYDKCVFEGCDVGVKVNGASNISIYNSDFTDDLISPILLNKIRGGEINVKNNSINNFVRSGVQVTNCLSNRILNIINNTFSLALTGFIGSSKFLQTGISIVNAPFAYSGAVINNNDFVNLRYGVYGNGLKKVTIDNNYVHFNRPWTTMQGGLHAGMLLEGNVEVKVTSNTIEYLSTEAILVPLGSSIAQNLRGFVLKGNSNSTISNNTIINCGRPIRCVDDLSQTYFNCNTFNGCFDSWQFSNVTLPNQGAANQPADNVWVNFPRPVTPAPFYKLSGNLSSPKTYYFKPVSGSNSTYIPLPQLCANLATISTNGIGPCNMSPITDVPIEITDFVISDSVHLENDSIYQIEKIRQAMFLAATDSLLAIPDYTYWYNEIQNSETGTYARMLDSSYNRMNLIQSLASLSNFRLPEYELKRDLFRDALINQMSEEDEIVFEEESLMDLGYTPAWLSTNAVYLIRALFELEVDDEELGLRTMQYQNLNSNCTIQVYQENDQLHILKEEPAQLEFYNSLGQLILTKKIQSQIQLSSKEFNHPLFYSVYSNTCTKKGRW